jgi:hypothetical protein
MNSKELFEIQDPFVYLSELARKTDRVLKAGESLVSSGEWETLPEYGEEIKQIAKEFERVPVLLAETHEKIVADKRRRDEEKAAEIERQRLAREERLRREAEYDQAIATFRISYSAFQTKATWKNVNDALVAGEVVESNPMFVNDARRGAISTQLATLRSKKSYLEDVRAAAADLIAEREQAQVVGQQ